MSKTLNKLNPALQKMLTEGQLQAQLAEAEAIEAEMAKQVHTFSNNSVTYKCDGTGKPLVLELKRTVSPSAILEVIREAHETISKNRQIRSNEFVRKMQL